jgi:hypothetical protein
MLSEEDEPNALLSASKPDCKELAPLPMLETRCNNPDPLEDDPEPVASAPLLTGVFVIPFRASFRAVKTFDVPCALDSISTRKMRTRKVLATCCNGLYMPAAPTSPKAAAQVIKFGWPVNSFLTSPKRPASPVKVLLTAPAINSARP